MTVSALTSIIFWMIFKHCHDLIFACDNMTGKSVWSSGFCLISSNIVLYTISVFYNYCFSHLLMILIWGLFWSMQLRYLQSSDDYFVLLWKHFTWNNITKNTKILNDTLLNMNFACSGRVLITEMLARVNMFTLGTNLSKPEKNTPKHAQ